MNITEADNEMLKDRIKFLEEENERLKSNDDMYVQLDKTNEKLRQKLEVAIKALEQIGEKDRKLKLYCSSCELTWSIPVTIQLIDGIVLYKD